MDVSKIEFAVWPEKQKCFGNFAYLGPEQTKEDQFVSISGTDKAVRPCASQA
jgi:hypothetical protein